MQQNCFSLCVLTDLVELSVIIQVYLINKSGIRLFSQQIYNLFKGILIYDSTQFLILPLYLTCHLDCNKQTGRNKVEIIDLLTELTYTYNIVRF